MSTEPPTLRESVGNSEGEDFLLNCWTYRVTASRGPVTSAYVRFSDEEGFTSDDYPNFGYSTVAGQLMEEVRWGMSTATECMQRYKDGGYA